MYQCLFVVGLVALALTGCELRTNQLSLTDKPQTANFFIKLDWPNDVVVDSAGKEMRMPDGLQIVMEAGTFERKVQPLLTPRSPSSPPNAVRVNASFRLQQEEVVIGVVENEDGSGAEETRAYWVVKIAEVHSATWHSR